MNAADGPSLLRYQNNLERSALLAGYAYFPPLVINSLVIPFLFRAVSKTITNQPQA